MNYHVYIRLSHFIDARVTEMENDDGNMEEGIFIPFRKNKITKGKKAIVAKLMAVEIKKNLYASSHILLPYWGKGDELDKRREKFGYAPVVGYVRPVFNYKNKICDFRNLAGEKQIEKILGKDEH